MLDFTGEAVAVLAAVRDAEGTIVDFRCVDMTPAAGRELGRRPQDVVGTSLLELLPGHAHQGDLFGRYRRVVETGASHDMEIHYAADGIDGWWRNAAMRHGDGVIVRFANITERRRADLAARRLAAVVEQSSDFIAVSWRDGTVDFVNRAGLALLGLSGQAEARRQRIFEYVAPESAGILRTRVLPAIVREDLWQGELAFRHFDGGETVPALCNVFPVRDPNGRIGAYAVVARDMREARRLTAALGESEAKFRTIADTLPQMVWSTTADGVVDYCNARWHEFTGLAGGSQDGEGWNDLLHPQDRRRARALWRRSLETGEPYDIEYRLRHHSGEHRWTLARALPIRDAQGHVLRWFGSCTDVHAAKSNTERLRDAQLRLQLAMTAAEIGVWEYDPERGSVAWDARIRGAAGVEAENDAPLSYERDFLPLVHPDDRARVDAAIRATAREGRDLDIQYRIRPPARDGDMWVATAGLRVVKTDGSVNVIGTAVDISDDVSAMEEREIVAQELSHRIKNIFSVISGMIGLSARAYPQTRALADQLRERIAALGRAHDFVRSRTASSQSRPATLHGLARVLFEPYASAGVQPIAITGDDIGIDDRAATPLALLLHELATNAAKYGALAAAGGSVEIAVSREEDAILIEWKERGGPPVDRPPESEGFGSRLTVLSVERQLGGTIENRWEADGLRCRIAVPERSFLRG